MGCHVGRIYSAHGEEEECIQGFGEKGRKEKRAVGRIRSRWEDDIKMELREVRWGDMD
jgi:hypothetical protein